MKIQCNNIFIQTSQKLKRSTDYIGKSYLKCWFLKYIKKSLKSKIIISKCIHFLNIFIITFKSKFFIIA